VRSLSELSARQLGELRTKEKMIKDLNVALDERMKLIQSLNSSLDERGRLIEDLSRSLDDRAQIIESLKRIADERAAAMEEKERVIQLINQELETIKSHWTYRFASRLKRLFNFRRAKRN
jgi:methyl-accepting chemotaxis protein